MPDIDIDFANRNLALDKLKHVAARLDTDKRHNTGVYVQNIPYDPIENISTIEYKTAEDRGYFKIDFLNVNVYDKVKDRAHLTKLMETEPLWDLLLEDEFTDKLFHVNGHGSILRRMKPNNIEQLAAILAMIRPAKRHLIGKEWPAVLADVWVKPENDEYYFKKSHAHSYAALVVVHMNLLCEKIESGELTL